MADSPVVADVSLAPYTSFGIGGPARLFVEVSSREELTRVLALSRELELETLILGGGTNLLVSDLGFDGLAVRLALSRLEIREDGRAVRAGASVPTARLVEQLVDEGIAGLEFAAGLPGTVGGAICGNAGCFGHTLSERLVRASIVERDGRPRQVDDPSWFEFDYRRSRLAESGAVLTELVFALEPGDAAVLREEADRCLAVRARKHPPTDMRTAGSYFKNLPPNESGGRRRAAGALLDQAGAHGLQVGDAAVFERHANIIVNQGKATARDVLELAAEMKRRVREKFGVILEEEVRFVGTKEPSSLH